jgi:hypothetical protein
MEYGPLNRMTETAQVLKSDVAPGGRHFCGAQPSARRALKRFLDSGRPEDIPDFFARSALSNSERQALGRIDPAFMGGEYLADLMRTETMIARITVGRERPLGADKRSPAYETERQVKKR